MMRKTSKKMLVDSLKILIAFFQHASGTLYFPLLLLQQFSLRPFTVPRFPFSCFKSVIETLEKGVNYVQS